MKLLNWVDAIKENVVSKEDILRKVEKAEIIYLIQGSVCTILSLVGLTCILISPSGSKATWAGLATIVCGTGGVLEATIKSYFKLERYKAHWDKIEQMQNENRKMQAEDL